MFSNPVRKLSQRSPYITTKKTKETETETKNLYSSKDSLPNIGSHKIEKDGIPFKKNLVEEVRKISSRVDLRKNQSEDNLYDLNIGLPKINKKFDYFQRINKKIMINAVEQKKRISSADLERM